MSSKSAKRRGRLIVVDGVKYYWKIRISNDQSVVDVLMPTGKRLSKLVGWAAHRKAFTPKDVAAFMHEAGRKAVEMSS